MKSSYSLMEINILWSNNSKFSKLTSTLKRRPKIMQ
jgi:hypothetical protein